MAMSDQSIINVPSNRRVAETVKENPKLVDHRQVKEMVHQSLEHLSSIEERLDRLENKGVIGRVFGSITGSTNKELITLMRDLTQAQQTSIKLVLTLAVYHAQNMAVMDEILDELDRAKGLHTRTASHIEFLYEQVEMIRDSQPQRKKPVLSKRVIWLLAIVLSISITAFFLLK